MNLPQRILRRWPRIVGGAIALTITFVADVWVGQGFPDVVPALPAPGQRSPLDERLMLQASRIIQNNFYNADLGEGQLSEGSINGMVDSLGDPYSRYLTARQYQSLLENAAGRHFAAIGVSLGYRNGYPVVVGVLPNSPALRGGVETDDVILQIDGRDTRGLRPDQSTAARAGRKPDQIDPAPRNDSTGPDADARGLHKPNRRVVLALTEHPLSPRLPVRQPHRS